MEKIEEHSDEMVPKSKLIELQKEFNEFAYIVSHDLKAPVRAIATLIEFLEEDLGDNLDDNCKGNLELLKGRAHRLGHLINGATEFSRAGRSHSKLEIIDFNLVINETINTLKIGESVTIKVPDELPIVIANGVGMRKVMFNLLSNAITHNDKDAIKIEIKYDADDTFHRFRVIDNGPGIAEKFHDKIFGMFQTLVARDHQDKSGVGLPVARKIIEHFGGALEVQSDGENGTEFRFSIPVHNAELEDQLSAQEQSNELA